MLGRLPNSRLNLILSALLLLAISGVFADYTNVSACRTLGLAGEYRVNNSLTNANSSNSLHVNACIFISASNVVLDCQGNTITDVAGTNTFGILAASLSSTLRNVTIKNCVVDGYYTDIPTYGSGNIIVYAVNETNIINNEVMNAVNGAHDGQGLGVIYSDMGNVSGNDAHDNDYGLQLSAGGQALMNYSVDSNDVHGNANNLIINKVNTSGVTSNRVYGSTYAGDSAISVRNGKSLLLWNNTVYNNAGYGIGIGTIDGLNASSNNVTFNGDVGVYMSTGSYSVFDNNSITFNSNNGLQLSGVSNSNFTNNYVSSQNNSISGFASGFSISGSSTGNIFAYNTVYNNSGHGFDISGSNWNYIYWNNISYCRNGHGIQLTGSNYNTIVGNNESNSNNIYNYAEGMSLSDSNYTLVENNTFGGNSGDGIYSSDSIRNNFTNNTIASSNSNGLRLDYRSTYNRIVLNNFTSNGGSAVILMNGSANNVVSGNYLYGNGGTGAIQVQPAWTVTPADLPLPNITIFNNTILSSSGDGILLIYSNGSTIDSNTISGGTGTYSSAIMLDNSSLCTMNNNTVSYFPISAIVLQGFSNYNNVSNSVFHSVAYGMNWANAIQFTNTTDTAFPEGNALYNVTVYNSSRYVALSTDFAGHQKENFTNFTLCNDSSLQSCVNFDFAQVDNAFLGYQGGGTDNLFIGSDFISMDGSNWGAAQFDGPANITLPAGGCTGPNGFTIYRSPVALPLSKPDVLSTGALFTPGHKVCISANALQFNVSTFSGYALKGSFNDAVTTPGLTTLTQDYSQGSADVAAIGITVDDVILDLNGHVVENGTGGIYIEPGLTNVTIVNGIIRNVTTAIFVNSSNGTLIRNMTISNCSTGIYLDPSYNNTIINNTIFNGTAYGIYMENSHNNTMANNTIYSITLAGIYVTIGSNNSLIDNSVSDTGSYGIYVNDSNYSVLSGNVVNKAVQVNQSYSYFSTNYRLSNGTANFDDSLRYVYGANGIITVAVSGLTDITVSGYNGTQNLSAAGVIETGSGDYWTVVFNNASTGVNDCAGLVAWFAGNGITVTCEPQNYENVTFGALGYGTDYQFIPVTFVGAAGYEPPLVVAIFDFGGITILNSGGTNATGNRIENSTQYGLYATGTDYYISGNNILRNTNVNIYLYNVSDSLVWMNNASNSNEMGLLQRYGFNVNISNNVLSDNTRNAITLVFTDFSLVDGNNVTGGGEGIIFYQSRDAVVSGNNISGTLYTSITLSSGTLDSNVTGNHIHDCGPGLGDISRLGVYIYTPNEDTPFSSHWNNNSLVMGNKIENCSIGVLAQRISNYVFVYDNNITDMSNYGVLLNVTNNSQVVNNILVNSSRMGITISGPHSPDPTHVVNNVIANNLLVNPGAAEIANYSVGIGLYKNDNGRVINNTVQGFTIVYNIDNDDYGLVANNTAADGYLGFHLVEVDYTAIDNNTAHNASVSFDSNSCNFNNYTNNVASNGSYFGFQIYGNVDCCGKSKNLRIINMTIRDAIIGIYFENSSELISIDNYTGYLNNMSVYAQGTNNINITNSRFTQHHATTTDVFQPYEVIALVNSTAIKIEDTSFYQNDISAVLIWNTTNVNINRVNITYSNSTTFAYGDSDQIELYPNTFYVTISYLNCSNGGTFTGGGCIHHYGNVSNLVVDHSVFDNMTGGLYGRLPHSGRYNDYFVGDTNSFTVTNCSFNNLAVAMFIHSDESFAIDNNITNSWRGTGVDSIHLTMRNNNYTGNIETFGLTSDESEQQYGYAVHNYMEHDIDTSNTIDGRPIYYYSSWSGNDKHNYIEADPNGGYYACIDCSNVLFENISAMNVLHVVYIGFSDNATVRNVTGQTMQGIKFFATNNSQAYNNTLTRIVAEDPFFQYSPSDYLGSMRAVNLIWSNNVNVSNTTVLQNVIGIYLAETTASRLSNITVRDSIATVAVGLINSHNNTFDNISLTNLTSQISISQGGSSFIESTMFTSGSRNNTFNRINISGIGGAYHYYSSLDPLRNTTTGRNFDTGVIYIDPGGGGDNKLGFTISADNKDLTPAGVDGTFDIDAATLNFTPDGVPQLPGQDAYGNYTFYYDTNIATSIGLVPPLTCWDWENLICNNTGGTIVEFEFNCTCHFTGKAWQNNSVGENYTWQLSGAGEPVIVPGYTDPPFLKAISIGAYYQSLSNSTSHLGDSWFDNVHTSFDDHDVYIANTTTPTAPLPAGTAILTASPPPFLEIQNMSSDSWMNLTFYYTDAMVPPGYQEMGFRIWKYSTAASAWQRNGFITSQAVDPTANTVTAYNITNFSSPFGPLAETLPCLNLSDNSTWQGRITNISSSYPISLSINVPVTLCTGTYNMPAFQNATSTGYAFFFNSNSGLDCNGSTLIGSGNGTVFVLADTHNATIRNCTLRSYNRGLEAIHQGTNITIEDNIFTGFVNSSGRQSYGVNFGEDANPFNLYSDIWIVNNTFENFRSTLDDGEAIFAIFFGDSMQASHDIVVANNTIRNFTLDIPSPGTSNLFAIGMASGPTPLNLWNVTVANNTISGLSTTASDPIVGGIADFGMTNSTINNNRIYDLSGDLYVIGIYIDSSSQNNYASNEIYNLSGSQNVAGIYSASSPLNNFTSNEIYNVSGDGIYLFNSSNNNTVIANNVSYCSARGIYVYQNSDANNITSNNVVYNNLGIALDESHGTGVYNNTADNNSVAGILLESATPTFIINNAARENGALDFYITDLISAVDCNIIVQNLTGSGNRPINFSNTPVEWGNIVAAEISLCDADHSNLTNVTVRGSDTLRNNGFMLQAADNVAVRNSNSSSNLFGVQMEYSNEARIINNTFSDNGLSGISGIFATGSLFANNSIDHIHYSALGNTFPNAGIGIYFGSNNISNNTIADNEVMGLMAAMGDYSNITDNLIYNSTVGIALYLDHFDNLTNNTAYGNTLVGVNIIDSDNTTIQNDYYFGNGVDFIVNSSDIAEMGISAFPLTLNLSNVIIDNPSGGLQNFTNVSINDVLAINDSYLLNWSAMPAILPGGKASFANKYLNISPLNNGPVLDMIKFSWIDSELPGFAESNFELWKYNASSGWTQLNNTPNTTLHTLTVFNHNISSDYAILQESNCPVLNAPGSYTLMANMVGAPNNVGFLGGDACIVISTSNVALDCNSYNISNNGTAPTTFGIAVASGSFSIRNVTVANCHVNHYTIGLAAQALNDSVMSGNQIYNISQDALYMIDGVNNLTLLGNRINQSDNGIQIARNCANNTVDGNTIFNTTGWGIAINTNTSNTMVRNNAVSLSVQCVNSGVNVTNITYVNNTLTRCSSAGFIFGETVNYTFINNTANDFAYPAFFFGSNTSSGLFVGNNCTNVSRCFEVTFGSHHNTIANNTMRNCNDGMRFSSGVYSVLVSNNTILNSSGSAITLSSTLGNITIVGNFINYTARQGIDMGNASSNNITSNTINNTSGTGIFLNYASYNNFSSNRIYNANSPGISLQNGSTGNSFRDDIVQESHQYDLEIINSLDYTLCNTTVQNMTGSGDRPIVFVNSSVNIGNAHYSELILCGAIGANVTNATVHGSDTLQNNGIVVAFSNGTALNGTNSSGNYIGIYLGETYGARLINNTNEYGAYGEAIIKSSNSSLDQQKVYGGPIGMFIQGDSDWNNITNSQFHDLTIGSPYPQLAFVPSGGTYPEFNRVTNVTIYNSTNYLAFFSVMPNASNFTNLKLCINTSDAGCINWDFANITYAVLTSGTDVALASDFVSLNDSDARAVQFNGSANVTINVSSCAAGNGVGVLKAPGFPLSKAAIQASGSEYEPPSQSCITPTTKRFGVNSFSGYTESPPFNISVLIDGVSTTAFYNSGEPYNLTVRVKYANGTAVPSAGVRLYEDNGYLPFALPQYTDSNVSNYVYAKSTTRADGNISLTVVPTGAAEVISENVGAYNVTVRAYSGNVHKGTVTLTVTRRNLPYANATAVSVPNKGNVGYFNDDVYRVYSRVKEWLALGGSGGGEKYNITVYTNGTVLDNSYPLRSGKPYGLNITVRDYVTLNPIPNARVQVTEQDGLPPLALPQYTDTNVSNVGVGYTNTTATGMALISFIPTGNPNLDPSPLPEQYNASLQVYVNGTKVADVPLNVTSRSLSYTPSGVTQPVYNQGNVGSFNDKVYVIYSRIVQWLGNH